MSTYLSSIRWGVVSFPFIALLLSLPFALYEYHKYGSVSFWKTFEVFAFIFYLICAYYLVILPLPKDHTAVVSYAQSPQLMPFAFIQEIISEYAGKTGLVALLRTRAFYEAVFNVALTIPLGIFLRYLCNRSWWQTLIIGFLVTLFFEVSQLTGLFGYYAHPYRLFDVDDLMMNTLGTIVGFWITGPLCRFLPDMRDVNERAVRKGITYTTFTRRLASFVVDMILVLAAYVICAVLPFSSALREDPYSALLLQMVFVGIFFMLVPALMHGSTLGQRLVGLRIVHPDGSPAHWYNYIVRYGLLFWVFLMLPLWSALLLPDDIEGVTLDIYQDVLYLIYAVWFLSLAIRAVRSAFKYPFVMLNGIISNTRIMSAKQADLLCEQRDGQGERGAGESEEASLDEDEMNTPSADAMDEGAEGAARMKAGDKDSRTDGKASKEGHLNNLPKV